jgi:adenosine deaminase
MANSFLSTSDSSRGPTRSPSRWAQLPKVDLHRHLDCSIRPTTLRERLEEQGVALPETDAEFRRQFLVTEPMCDLESVLRKFLAAQQALSTPDFLTRVTRECIEDAVAEGIRILELRYAPTFIQDGHEHLSFEEIHAAIVAGVESCRHLPIAVGLIAILQRIKPVAVAERVTEFALTHRGTFVGLDLADNEVGFDARPFEACFARARAGGLRITVHAGEAPSAQAAENVRIAAERLGAERIGHGIQVAHDPAMMAWVRERGLVLEVCPTSNVLTQSAASIAEHPLRRLLDADIKCTLNTDDPGVFDLDLTHEYDAVANGLGLTEVEFQRMNEIAARASFIPLEMRRKVWPSPLS